MKIVESISCENIVETLFLNQRCFPFVNFFQNENDHRSCICPKKNAMIEAIDILIPDLKIVVNASLSIDLSAAGR